MKKPWVVLVWFKKNGSDVKLLASSSSAKALRFPSKADAELGAANAELPEQFDRMYMKAVKM